MDTKTPVRPSKAIAFLVRRVGPYHHARLRALAAGDSFSVCAIEFRPEDKAYAWDRVGDAGGYVRLQASSARNLSRALNGIRPDAVVCVGYADPEIHRAVSWALRRGLPLVTCSDSTYDDEPRTILKEALKRLVLSAFDAALVAGSRAHDYLVMLGLERDCLFRPWDVVDNAHFELGSDAARRSPAELRASLKLPKRYFVCVSRFVAKKNLGKLVEAYARYAVRAGNSAWSLVLSGAGPMEADLRAQAAAAGLGARICFPGFLQYQDLPACYGLAEALVLPSVSDQWGLVVNEAMAAGLPVLVSSRCGCAPDLVRAGVNGFTFEPGDTAALEELLTRTAGMPAEARSSMGARSREIVAAYTPQAFAASMAAAVGCALIRRRGRKELLMRAVVRALAARPPVDSRS